MRNFRLPKFLCSSHSRIVWCGSNWLPHTVLLKLVINIKALFVVVHNDICVFVAVSEIFYLILWENEGKASVHAKSELREPSSPGEMCEVKFGRTYYTGKIACCGKFRTFNRTVVVKMRSR